MAATWGRLEVFDKDLTDWTAYCEVVEQYFAANEVTAPVKKTAVLLCSMGAAAYSDLKNAVAPKLPKELKFEKKSSLHWGRYTNHRRPLAWKDSDSTIFHSKPTNESSSSCRRSDDSRLNAVSAASWMKH